MQNLSSENEVYLNEHKNIFIVTEQLANLEMAYVTFRLF